jgi:hypothetical protein
MPPISEVYLMTVAQDNKWHPYRSTAADVAADPVISRALPIARPGDAEVAVWVLGERRLDECDVYPDNCIRLHIPTFADRLQGPVNEHSLSRSCSPGMLPATLKTSSSEIWW